MSLEARALGVDIGGTKIAVATVLVSREIVALARVGVGQVGDGLAAP